MLQVLRLDMGVQFTWRRDGIDFHPYPLLATVRELQSGLKARHRATDSKGGKVQGANKS